MSKSTSNEMKLGIIMKLIIIIIIIIIIIKPSIDIYIYHVI